MKSYCFLCTQGRLLVIVLTQKWNSNGESYSRWKIYADCSKKYLYFFIFWEKCSHEALPKPEPTNIPLVALHFLQMSYSSSISNHYFKVKTHAMPDVKLIWMTWNRKVVLNYHCSQICCILKIKRVHFWKRTMKYP